MKLFKNLLVASVLFLGVMTTANAQSKVAHINTQELVKAMPEMKQMEEDLNKVAQQYDTDYKAQGNSLQAKLQKYEADAATQTDTENQKRAAEVQDLRSKLQLYARQAEQELAKKQQDLYLPIEQKAQKAIQDVATAKGIQYVFDSSPGRGLLVFKGEDLMVAVKTKLGLK